MNSVVCTTCGATINMPKGKFEGNVKVSSGTTLTLEGMNTRVCRHVRDRKMDCVNPCKTVEEHPFYKK